MGLKFFPIIFSVWVAFLAFHVLCSTSDHNSLTRFGFGQKAPGFLNESCVESGGPECYVPNSTCLDTPDGRQCKCKPEEFVESWREKNTCIEIVRNITARCDENPQCITGMGELFECWNYRCRCIEDYGYYEGACYPKATLGEPCTDQEECYVGVSEFALCSTEGLCACQPGAVEYWDNCWERKLIGDECNDGLECAAVIDGNVDCDNKICECRLNSIASRDRTSCLGLEYHLNGTCKEIQQCLVVNSECLDGSCRCEKNTYVESRLVPDTCIHIVDALNEPCTEDVQCESGIGVGAECVAELCQCGATYGDYGGRCYVKAELGDICEADEECYVGVSLYATCANNSSGGNRTCVCIPGAIEFDSSCYEVKIIGDGCSIPVECQVSIGGDVVCDLASATCECGDDSVPSGNKRNCLVKAGLNEACEEVVQCQAVNSECIRGKCSCETLYVESNATPGTCVQVVDELNKNCSESVQCTSGIGGGAECSAGVCKCRQGYTGTKCGSAPGNSGKSDGGKMIMDPIIIVLLCGAAALQFLWLKVFNSDKSPTAHMRN